MVQKIFQCKWLYPIGPRVSAHGFLVFTQACSIGPAQRHSFVAQAHGLHFDLHWLQHWAKAVTATDHPWLGPRPVAAVWLLAYRVFLAFHLFFEHYFGFYYWFIGEFCGGHLCEWAALLFKSFISILKNRTQASSPSSSIFTNILLHQILFAIFLNCGRVLEWYCNHLYWLSSLSILLCGQFCILSI